MQFRIAATFTDSLAKLSADEQKAAKTRAFDLQVDPSASGLSFHRIDRTKDRNFWSVRVNRDIRLIVHRTPSSIMLVHVDHHDAAYRWAQRRIVESEYRGPARVSGSAGTGKTIVALHRAVYLARAHPDARILLATFSNTLANALRERLGSLVHNRPSIAERLEVHSMGGIARRLYEANLGTFALASDDVVLELIERAAAGVEGHRFGPHFLWTEWSRVVDAWQLENWEAYRDVMRLGRKTRLAETQRAVLWSIFSKVQDGLVDRRLLTEPRMFRSPPQVKAIRVCLYAPEMPTASHPFSIRLWELMRDFLG